MVFGQRIRKNLVIPVVAQTRASLHDLSRAGRALCAPQTLLLLTMMSHIGWLPYCILWSCGGWALDVDLLSELQVARLDRRGRHVQVVKIVLCPLKSGYQLGMCVVQQVTPLLVGYQICLHNPRHDLLRTSVVSRAMFCCSCGPFQLICLSPIIIVIISSCAIIIFIVVSFIIIIIGISLPIVLLITIILTTLPISIVAALCSKLSC